MPTSRRGSTRTRSDRTGAPALIRAARGGSRVALAVAIGVLGILAGTLPAGARSAGSTQGRAGLPPGWELCILRGLGAPVTSANVVDLDEWQVAEGGSTANDLAYNPFNTRRETDQAQAALPTASTVSGFPAFTTWPAGCAATVATILQSNMTAIASALAAGKVPSPQRFLKVVDQTPWCAPSDGMPCYLSLITGPAVHEPGTAMDLVHSSAAALATYDADATTVSDVETSLAAEKQQLAVDDIEVVFAQYAADAAKAALRRAVLYQYTSSPSLDQVANLLYFQAPTQQDLLGKVYSGLDLQNLVQRLRLARATAASVQSDRAAAQAAVSRTTATLVSAQAALGQAVAHVAGSWAALDAAGACTGGPGPAPAAPTSGSPPAALRACLATLKV